MHYPCFHCYILITHYHHYYPLLHVTNVERGNLQMLLYSKLRFDVISPVVTVLTMVYLWYILSISCVLQVYMLYIYNIS